MRKYVFCCPRCPAHGMVCATCDTKFLQLEGTTNRFPSTPVQNKIPLSTTYCSSPLKRSVASPALALVKNSAKIFML